MLPDGRCTNNEASVVTFKSTYEISERLSARPASVEDRAFVSETFCEALAGKYEGDHVSHAERVLDAHLAGEDKIGHFSLSQKLFILCADPRPEGRVGLINFVLKRQGTLKISPFFVRPAHRGLIAGEGSALIDWWKLFARELGARQVYGTISAVNRPLLRLGLQKGFVLAGVGRKQYGDHDEMLVYHDLVKAAASAPTRATYIRLLERRDLDGLHQLIRLRIGEGNGEFLDALLRGYERRSDLSPDRKSKLVYVAVDDCDRVEGVAALGPKKGGAIKLSPLLADTPWIVGRLARFVRAEAEAMKLGRKIYVHIDPDPDIVSTLQAEGWTVEAVLPRAYDPARTTLQFALMLQSTPGVANG